MIKVHSKEYMDKFRRVIKKTYNYEDYMEFMVVPSLTSKPTLSYFPFLNYTDRYSDNLDDLKKIATEQNYLIRTINRNYTEYKDGDTVTMRIKIESNTDEDLMALAKSRCRNKIRKSHKNYNYILKDGRECIEDFYMILRQTYHKHGTPLMPIELFYNLQDEFEDKMMFFVVYDENNNPAAAISTCIDGTLACCPWGGVEESYTNKFAGYFLYFEVLKTVAQRFKIDIFDFGRSPYNGPTYKFKTQFGAKPVKIDLIKPTDDDIYSKYQLAAQIWKKLPNFVVDYIGPKLTKYLVDL